MRSSILFALAAASPLPLAAPSAVAMNHEVGGGRELIADEVTISATRVAVLDGEIDEISSRRGFDLVEKVLSPHSPGGAAGERDETAGRHRG